MKLLLTSAGIKNTSILDALVDLLGKPIAESDALCIPTASYAHPMAGPGRAWNFISGQEPRCPMTELGWKSMGVLELTALGLGWLLGGTVGLGTLAFALSIGPLAQLFIPMFTVPADDDAPAPVSAH